MVLIFLILFRGVSSAQPTFSKRLHFGFPAAVLTSVVPVDSGYFVTGIIADSIPPFNTGNIFAFFNLEGEWAWGKTITDTIQTFETWNGTLRFLSDGTLVNTGYTLGPSPGGLAIKYSTSGDTLETFKYRSYFFPQEPVVFSSDLITTSDEGILIVNRARNPSGISNDEVSLVKIDSLGDVQWHRPYGVQNRRDRAFSLSKLSENEKYIVGALRDNRNLVNEDYISRTWIFQTDSLGNIEWEYLSPPDQLQFGAADLCPTPDGGFIVASAIGTEFDRPSVNDIDWDIYIYKLEADRSFSWGTYFRVAPTHIINRIKKMIVVSDGSGFIAAGKVHRVQPDSAGWDINGFLAKVSPQGDSLWSRQLNIVESPADDHEFIDIRETPDGGFILVGEALDYTQSPQPQQAWIIKVDEWGCLVPGCHLISSSEEAEQTLENLRLYPNPAQDYLNVFLPPGPAGAYELRILNAQGQVMKQYRFDQTDITHLLPVYDLPGGAYWLQVVRKGGRIDSQGFVVGK